MSILEDLELERQQYGRTMTDDECVELINTVAWKNRHDSWGLNAKPLGKNGTRYDGEKVAHDVLHHKETNIIYDVLVGAGAQSTPTFNKLGVNTNTARPWVAPIAPQREGSPLSPTPQPQPPPAAECKFQPCQPCQSQPCKFVPHDDSDLKAKVAHLTALVENLSDRLANGLEGEASTRWIGTVKFKVKG